MLQLKLEAIAGRESQRHGQTPTQQAEQEARVLLMELKEGGWVAVGRATPERMRRYRPMETSLNGVYLCKTNDGVYIWIDDQNVGEQQGTFGYVNGNLVYVNDCELGSIVVPAFQRKRVLTGAELNRGLFLEHPYPNRGVYGPVKPGDRFFLG